jgi:hypothetical protein
MANIRYDAEMLFEAFDREKADSRKAAHTLCEEGIQISSQSLRQCIMRHDRQRYEDLQRKHRAQCRAKHTEKSLYNKEFAERTVAQYEGRKFGPFDIVPSELQWSINYLNKHRP